MNPFRMFTAEAIGYLSSLFVFVIGLGALLVVVVFIRDVTQTKDAIRRNYPVIGRFRYLFTRLGEFFRQYFFALDREELPFNHAAEPEDQYTVPQPRFKDNTVAFGSTRSLTPVGTIIFVNCPFPTLEEHAGRTRPRLRSDPYTPPAPYRFSSIINISAMSFGALSVPAIRALSYGAKSAGCWLNTGEGGLAPYHLEGGADVVFQIGTAKYGVRAVDGRLDDSKLAEIAALEQVRMFELKLSQGAKPGKGGILPAVKVTREIAKIRGIEPFKDFISPNRHPEIGNVSELLDSIGHIRAVAQKPVGFKAVIGAYGWLETMCQEIHRRGLASAPDFITIDFRRWGNRRSTDAAYGQCRSDVCRELQPVRSACR